MANIFDDTLNFGFGLFAYSREKLEKFVEEMVEAGRVEKQEARGVMKDLMQKGEEQRAEIKKIISEEVKKATDDLGLRRESLTKEDIRSIIREELANMDERA